jgi:hypothetical protein
MTAFWPRAEVDDEVRILRNIADIACLMTVIKLL